MQSELAESVLVPYGIENCKDLVQKVFTQIYSELINAVDNAPYESKDNQSYVILVSASEKVRYLLMKLIVLLKWTKNLEVIENCQRMIFYDNNNVQQLTNSTNILFAMIGRMHISLQPVFPLNSAISILTEGKYPFIPPVCDSKAPFLSKLSMLEGKKLTNRILKTRILTEPIPSFVTSIHVEDQVIICEEPDFFIVQFTNTQPTFDSTMTVTTLRIYNNNNTRMTVFPYFSSEQLSRIINTLNHAILQDTDLSIILNKIYSILYFIITKQILYVLYLQLNNLSPSQKATYGLADFSYLIDQDLLSFSFWKKNPLKRMTSLNERTRIEISREEDPNTHLMMLRGKSYDYEFQIDLKQYRIFDVILTCIQYHQHTLLSEYRDYLEKELVNSHYTLEENRLHNWIQEIYLHIHSTPISLILTINSFTGEFEISLSDTTILSWCEFLLVELRSLIQAKYTIIDKLDQFFPYCVLYQIARSYLQTSTDYSFVYSHYENEPCLYLPCLFTKEPPVSSTHYFILIRLLQNTCIPHTASSSSLSPMNTPAFFPSKSAYHSINNQMNGFNEYLTTEEIGFDIDGNELPSDSSCSEEDKIDPWMIDLIGVKQKRIFQPGTSTTPTKTDNTIELLQNIHRKVVCSASSIASATEEVNSSIDKLLPRLRYESLVSTISLLKQYKCVTSDTSDSDRRSSQIVCNGVKLALKVEDSMEIRVLQGIREEVMSRYMLKRGCYQNIKKRENQVEYMIFPNSSPLQFRSFLDSYSKIFHLYQFLNQSTKETQFPFCSSLEFHFTSLFSMIIAYRFPYDSNQHILSILFPPWNTVTIQWDLNLPAVTASLHPYLLSSLNSRKQFDIRVLLLGIAAQYLYLSIWKELQVLGILKTDGMVMLYSIGISRMELRIRYNEQVSFYLKLDLNSVTIEPKDSVSDRFLSTLTLTEKNSIQQNYTKAPMYIIDLIKRRRNL